MKPQTVHGMLPLNCTQTGATPQSVLCLLAGYGWGRVNLRGFPSFLRVVAVGKGSVPHFSLYPSDI